MHYGQVHLVEGNMIENNIKPCPTTSNFYKREQFLRVCEDYIKYFVYAGVVLYFKINGFFPYSHLFIITILILPNYLDQSRVCVCFFQRKICFVKKILV